MKHRLWVLYRWGRLQLRPWLQLIAATLGVVSLSPSDRAREKLHASLGKINLLPVLQSFYEFLDDLPLWFY